MRYLILSMLFLAGCSQVSTDAATPQKTYDEFNVEGGHCVIWYSNYYRKSDSLSCFAVQGEK